jgi:hypothetical protein
MHLLALFVKICYYHFNGSIPSFYPNDKSGGGYRNHRRYAIAPNNIVAPRPRPTALSPHLPPNVFSTHLEAERSHKTLRFAPTT